MATLYELTDEMLRLQTLLTEEELTEEETDEVNTFIECCKTDIAEKADGIAKVIRNMAADADVFSAEADRLAKAARARKNAVERLKNLMLYSMQATDTKKIGTSIGTWLVQNNPKSVEIADTVKVEDLPARFVKIKTEPNKSAMMDAYKNGEDLPIGCAVVQKPGVRFK